MRVGAVLCGGLGSLLLAELLFRVLEIEPPRAPPADVVDAFKVSNDLNSLGLREPEGFPPPRRPGEFRIAFLGDSMTYGEGVEAEEAFPAVIWKRLKNLPPSDNSQHDSVLVVNMGKIGDDTPGEVARFRHLADTIDPDLVVLVMYVNDFAGADSPHAALHNIYRLRDSLTWPSHYSRLYEYAERKFRIRAAFAATVRSYRADAEGSVEPDALRPVAAAVAELRDLCKARNARLVVCMMPWLVRLNDYQLLRMHAGIKTMCDDLGIPFCDLLPAVADQPDASMRVSPANHHPSAAAHERIASFLGAWLAREKLLTRGPS